MIGKRTWHFGETEAQIQKSIKRDTGTTQESLGFRICGMQVFQPPRGEVWEPERRQGKLVTDKTMQRILKGFASSNYGWWEVSDSDCPEPNGALVEEVYGGERGVIAQLKELEKWFQTQTHFHFYSSSVLIIYDGIPEPADAGVTGDHPPDGRRRKRKVSVHLIDFAHVVNGGGSVDVNFLHGLQSLICQLTAVLESYRQLSCPA
ncbi:hypothetical protein CBR_g44488 [Chara braunii]|uniref:Inositol polyphosphate multikinase n=1 Tax=Chara braunii TaxID=69332 RepID=A0A388LXQ0_CHABU|nr:hypothetical protein CBR_g44488 [Chara braunii]|eukprot:GBG87031.1 hypothetical protein CBR_g44488 [Chara braunii]